MYSITRWSGIEVTSDESRPVTVNWYTTRFLNYITTMSPYRLCRDIVRLPNDAMHSVQPRARITLIMPIELNIQKA